MTLIKGVKYVRYPICLLSVYEIEVATTDKKDGGTIHNAWLILEGSLKTSKVFQMENSNQNKILRG